MDANLTQIITMIFAGLTSALTGVLLYIFTEEKKCRIENAKKIEKLENIVADHKIEINKAVDSFKLINASEHNAILIQLYETALQQIKEDKK